MRAKTVYWVNNSGDIVSRVIPAVCDWYQQQRTYERTTKLGAIKQAIKSFSATLRQYKKDWNNLAEEIQLSTKTLAKLNSELAKLQDKKALTKSKACFS